MPVPRSSLLFWLLLAGQPYLAWAQDAVTPGTHGGADAYEVVFEPVSGRFFRLVSYAEAQGNDRWANAADLQLLQADDGEALEREGWTVLASSNARESEPMKALDGDPATAWLSQGEPPHHLDIDLNETHTLAGFRYLPLADEKGAIHSFAVFVSEDGVTWNDPVMRGTLVPRADGIAEDTSRGAPDPLTLVRQDFAPPGMVHGPVAIDLDHHNRVYVAETYRYDGRGVIDNRGKQRREEDDLQTHNLRDRRVFLSRWLAEGELERELSARPGMFLADGSDFFSKFSEKIALLEDSDGDGRADRRRVVAEGFNDALDGTAAGVLVRGNDVYFACIPSLWLLTDTDGDDVADKRVALSRGYGVRTGWLGHDLHGLTWGPDGRLYFSVADRGYHVRTGEGKVHYGPDMGAVFRCWPDGSALELVAQGLRNPQELAFDHLGYLFTGDNNCDAGDRARLVYVVEGGDSGWRVSVQSLADRGPWLGEAMWEMPRSEGVLQPAWIVPPLAYLNSGPSGFAHYPGTGLPEDYQDYFFLCDYRGGLGSIQAFRLREKGASFMMLGHHAFHEGPAVSDVCFGYDGKVYVAEWGPGWGISPHARIYTLTHTPTQTTDGVREISRWFRHGFDQFDNPRLGMMLGHGDRRVRYEAQRVLADRESLETLVGVLGQSSTWPVARLHAVWGLGQVARNNASVLRLLVPYLEDADPEVRGRILRLCAEHGFAEAGEAAKDALQAVNHPRLQFHAAYAVGKLRPPGALEALLRFTQVDDEHDPYLRHAGVMGLFYLNDVEGLIEQTLTSTSDAVRLAAVLALRRFADNRVSRFLNDASALVATEAARAIYDREMTGAMEALAVSLENRSDGEEIPVPFLQRAIQVNFHLGTEAAAERLCRFARASHHPKAMRELALELLLAWDTPPKREGVWGRWRPLTRTSARLAKGPVRSLMQDLLEIEDDELRSLVQRLDALYGEEKSPGQLVKMIGNEAVTESLRIDALLALEKIRGSQGELFQQACRQALGPSSPPALRAAAIRSWARARGDEAVPIIRRMVDGGVTALEKQAAVRAAATLSPSTFKLMLGSWMQSLMEGGLDPVIQLDVFELAENSEDAELRAQAQLYRETTGDQHIHQLSLSGGDPVNGRALYETNLAAQCMRCHSLEGKGGDVGPPLDGLARRRDPGHILQSVVDPQAEVTEGYGTLTVTLHSGDLGFGTLLSENEEALIIRQEGRTDRIPLSEIAERSPVVSGMPPAGLVLKPRELRDLLAFLQTLE